MDKPMPAFKVDLSQVAMPECTVIGIFSGQQSLVRHVPHYRLTSQVSPSLNVSKAFEQLDENQYRVEMSVAVVLQQQDATPALSVAVTLEAIVVMVGATQEQVDFHLSRAIPARIYAHARVQIEALMRDSGYAPLTLPPASLEPSELKGSAQ